MNQSKEFCRHGFSSEGPCASVECNENRELRREVERLRETVRYHQEMAELERELELAGGVLKS